MPRCSSSRWSASRSISSSSSGSRTSPNTGDAKRFRENLPKGGRESIPNPAPLLECERTRTGVMSSWGGSSCRPPTSPELPSDLSTGWTHCCGNVEKRKRCKEREIVRVGSCNARASALVSPLRRARSASRAKQIPRAVAGRRKSPGSVDESETGSANDLAQRCLRVPRRQIVFLVPASGRARWPTGCGNVEKRKDCKLREVVFSIPCNPPPAALSSPLRRARDASRAKRILRAVAGRRTSPGSVDESETGSANELAQRGLRVPRRQFVFLDRNRLPRAGDRRL